MSSVITPFSQWIQAIKYDLSNLFQCYRNVFIHRAKLAGLCTDLAKFHKILGMKTFPNVPAEPNEANVLRHMVAKIGNLKQLFLSLDQAHAVSTLCQWSVEDVRQVILDFRKNFGALAMHIKLTNEHPCPPNPEQEKRDNGADCRDIVTFLTNYLNIEKIQPEFQTILETRLQEAQAVVTSMEEELMKGLARDKPLTKEQIFEEMRKFSMWELSHEDFSIQKRIGSGGYADVHLGIQKSTRKVVAVKMLRNEEFTDSTFRMFKREIEIFAELRHFGTLPFVGVCLTPPFYIVTEYMSGGSLYSRLHSKEETRTLDATKRTIIALGVAYAMQYIHSKKLVHRDLKSLNVLLDADDYPKVCDFGMSREIGDLMSGGVGTAQWMAPEVVNSEKYDEKSDVYSYGILLWELLTSDIPFRGLKDIQVVRAVGLDGKRPGIPQDCPRKLNKFIRLCWDQDPKRRPTFDDVARALESGEVVFPGTNMNSVRAYITRFIPSGTPSTGAYTNQELDVMIKGLDSSDPSSVLKCLRNSLSDESLRKRAVQSSALLPGLMRVCDLCDSASMAADIIGIFSILAKEPDYLSKKDVQKVLRVFFDFGTTQTKEIMDLISQTLPVLKELKLLPQQMMKLAAFLQTTDISTRIDMTKVFILILDHKIYQRNQSLRDILPFIISNCGADALEDLLDVSLDAVSKMIQFEEIKAAFIEYRGLSSITSVVTSKSSTICEKAIRVFETVVNSPMLPRSCIEQCVTDLPAVTQALQGDILARFLAAFVGLLNFKDTYHVLGSNGERAIPAIAKCFNAESPAAKLIALKICYALLMKNKTHKVVSNMAPLFVPLLHDEPEPVINMAAACLIAFVPDYSNINEIMNDDLAVFFNNALDEGSPLSIYGLRLCGAVANNLVGAEFLEKKGIIRKVAPFLQSTHELTQKLALMAYAAFSSSCPMSQAAIDVVPVFLDAMKEDRLSPYPIIFLSNVVIHPDSAIQCASALGNFASLLASADDTTMSGVLTTLMRVTSCPEALQNCRDSAPITEIYRTAEEHFDDQFFLQFLEVISDLSGTASGRQALAETQIPDLLAHKLDQLHKTDPNRPTIMRVLTRCQ